MGVVLEPDGRAHANDAIGHIAVGADLGAVDLLQQHVGRERRRLLHLQGQGGKAVDLGLGHDDARTRHGVLLRGHGKLLAMM